MGYADISNAPAITKSIVKDIEAVRERIISAFIWTGDIGDAYEKAYDTLVQLSVDLKAAIPEKTPTQVKAESLRKKAEEMLNEATELEGLV